jgi:hypothetical protein
VAGIGVVALGLGFLGAACSNGTSGAATTPGGTTAATTGPTTVPSSPAGSTGSSQPPVPTESPVPAESNPPGDIPDNTQFVAYRSAAGHVEIRAPEGWSRRTTSSSVNFTDKLNGITIEWGTSSISATVASVKRTEVPELGRTQRAFRLKDVKAVTLPGGKAIELLYGVNSAPNQVTGKQYRLVVEQFDFFRGGREARLVLSSPVGADNVDPWRIVSESFRWR